MTNASLPEKRSVTWFTVPLVIGFALCFLPFAFFALYLFFYTSRLDPALYQIEHILYTPNILWVQVLGCLGYLWLLWLVQKWTGKWPVKRLERWLLGCVFLSGLVWVGMAAVIPSTETTDAGICTDIAASFLQRLPLNAQYVEYIQLHPYQAGYILYSAALQWLFGAHHFMAVGAVNAVLLALAYAAVLAISRQCFGDEAVQRCVVGLLLFLVQPVLFCTFHYGNIPGLALALWSLAFLIRFLKGQRQKPWYFILAVLLCACACMLKMNYLLYACAMAVLLLLPWKKADKVRQAFQSALLAILLMVAVVFIKNIPQAVFQKATGIPLGRGMPQTAMLAMGFQDSGAAPGWWNGYNTRVMEENDFDYDEASNAAMKSFKLRAGYMLENPSVGAQFFFQKLVSQWCEPTFESIWVSKLMDHSTSRLSRVAASVYEGKLGAALELWMRISLWYLYALFAAGMGGMLRRLCRQKIEPLQATFCFLLPLAVLGGVAYHLLFEAKSQYAVTYLPLMIPFAGYSLSALLRMVDKKIKKRRGIQE